MPNKLKFILLLIAVLTSTFLETNAGPFDGYSEYSDGQLIQSTFITIQTDVVKDTLDIEICEQTGIYCASDCKTLVACSMSNTVITSNKCADLSPSTPYCIPYETGCSTIGDPSMAVCGVPVNFQCTETGYFPDPKNCSIYYVCTEEFVSMYSCPPRYVYDAKLSKCKVRRVSSDCPSINCNNNLGRYVAFPGNKAFYGYCGGTNSALQVTMFRCHDTENFIYNPSKANCEYVCKKEGWYEDQTNCQGFYECYRSGTKLLHTYKTCPNEYMFDKKLGICVAGTCPLNH